MADYFNEMGWTPLEDGQAPNHYLHLARLFREYATFDALNILEGEKLSPAASKVVVESLPQETITTEGSQCPICLKDHVVGSTVKKLPCNHTFHNQCITPWLSKTNSCPLCRYELPTDDEEYEAWKKEKERAEKRKEEIKKLHNSMFS